MEKVKRSISIVLMFIMLFQLMMPVNFAYGEILEDDVFSMHTLSEITTSSAIQATNVESQRNLEEIFNFELMTINGDSINDGDIITIDKDTLIQVKYTWDTQNIKPPAKAGDIATIQLSDAFNMVDVYGESIEVEGKNVGTYSIIDGWLKFEFNEGIETSAVKNGYVNLGLEFNLEKFKENIEQEIPFHDGSSKNITVIARPNLIHSGITKEGHPDSKENAKEITWKIDVINTSEEEITITSLEDTIPEGLGVARDFVIRELNIGLGGGISEGDKVTLTPVPTGFPIALGNMKPFSGYQIEFATDIEDYTKAVFTNNATFKYGSKSLPATATVSGLTRSNPIEKDGKQSGNKISWTIDVNKNGQEIADARVADNLPAGLTFEPGSIRVVKITQNGDKWITGDDHAGGTFTEFPIELGKLTSNDAYRITFDTTIDWSNVNNGVYLKDNGFKNDATLYDGEVNEENKLNDDDATVTINREPILEKVGADNVDYDNKTITWTVTVNKARHPFTELTVTDYLPAGLKLVGNVEIKDENNASFADFTSTNQTVSGGEHKGKTELNIILNNVGTKTLTIKYTTEITDFTAVGFTNTVGMGGVGVGVGGDDRVVTINPKSNTYTKSFAEIDYKEKTINWRVNVNPVREAIKSGFVITDTFTNNGLILLPSTVVVKLVDKNKNETLLDAGTNYVLSPIGDGYHNGFIITFNQQIDNAELVVTYATSYDPQKEVDGDVLIPHSNPKEKELYKNKAEFDGETENGITIDKESEAKTTVRPDSWNSGKKEGQLVHFDDEGKKVNDWVSGSERKIAWQIYLNYQEQKLGTGVSVTDTLAYAGAIDEDSIKVSIYNVKSNGATEITSTVLNDDKYSVVTTGSEFTLTFADNFAVEERYVIEFTTSVPDKSLENYTNNATVNVRGVEYPYSATLDYDEHNNFLDKSAVGVKDKKVFTGDEIQWQVSVNESLSIIQDAVITDTISAGHVYLDGSLEVYKEQAQGQGDALKEGVDYTLNVGTSGDGTVVTITLKNELKDTLILRYKTVVTEVNGQIGNAISLDGNSIKIDSIATEKLSARQFSSVGGEWAKDKGALRVTKVDAETKETITTNETTFNLWYILNGKKVQYTQENPFTTKKGVLEIGNLPLRTYYLKEVKAPTGYVVSEDELEVVVNTAVGNNKDNPIVAIGIFENTKEKTEVTAAKIWQDGSSPRPTVWFKLFRQIGSENKEQVPDAEIKALANGTTEVTWEGLDKTNIDGVDYIYTVEEVSADGTDFTPEDYVKAENGLTITNYYVSPTDASAKALKVWAGEPEDRLIDRPTTWFKLYRQLPGETEAVEVPGAEIKELSAGITEVVWTGLVKTDVNGKEYSFLVKEVDSDGNDFVPENYIKTEEGLTVTNTYTKKDVTATKVWNGGSSPRPTIWFELYRQVEGGELEKVEAEIKELVDGTEEATWLDVDKTDENGNEYNYSVKEVDAEGKDFVPSGYRKSEDGLTVTNTRNSGGGGGTTTPVSGKVTVKKVDEDKKTLSGAEFTLFDSKGKVVGKAVTGSDGTVSFEGLELGDYVLKETKAPEGYILDDSERDVTISGSDTKAFTVTNKKEEPAKPGRIEIVKVDEEGKLLSNAWFSLIDRDGVTLQNVETVNGKAVFEDVPVGKYSVKEVKAPEGYELSNKTISVTVDSNETITVKFVNKLSGTIVEPVKGSILINKVNEKSMALSGAEFTLYNENNEIIGTAVSDESGRVMFNDLAIGKYFVRETNAPEGYEFVSDPLSVNITEAKTYNYKCTNVLSSVLIEDPNVPMGWDIFEDPDVPKDTIDTLPDTGNFLNNWILAALGFVLVISGLLLNRKRINN